MSRSIDQRIVDMQFNNKQFEEGIADSLNSLDKLKNSLGNLGGGTLDNLQTGVDTIANKFSLLGIMGTTALQNITTSAMNAGSQLVKSLSISPIMDGFNEYELKMDSVQTIMSGSGESLETVNKYLDELNTYADKTIYSFKDMTANIGKFTNSGVSLEHAVSAIQGVSNLAAVSGANANEASRAMYNFAQALSAGHVKLIDWKSIENANMATVEFKNYLLEAGVAAGTLAKRADGMYDVLTTNASGTSIKMAIDATSNFNDSLQYQWMTTDALVSTLSAYADETTSIGKKAFAAAQDVKTFSQLLDTVKEAVGSGWAQTFEILIGDFEEAKQLWTGINNVVSGFVDSTSDMRNGLLRGWDELGGRTVLIEALKNTFEAVLNVLKPMRDAFKDIFPPMTSEILYNLTEALKVFTEKLSISDVTADKLKRTFSGLFSAVDILIGVFGSLWDITTGIISIFIPMGGGFLGLTAIIGDFLTSLRDAAKTADVFKTTAEKIAVFLVGVTSAIKAVLSPIFRDISNMISNTTISDALPIGLKNILETIFNTLIKVKDNIKSAVSSIAGAISNFAGIDLEPANKFADGLQVIFSPLAGIADLVKVAWEKLVAVFKWCIPIFQKIGAAIGEIFTPIFDALKRGFENMDFSDFIKMVNTGLFGALLIEIYKFVKGFNKGAASLSDVLGGVAGVLDGVRGSLEAYQRTLQAKAILTIAGAIALLAASLLVLSRIPQEDLTKALVGITVLFADLAVMMPIMSKTMSTFNAAKVAGMMKALGASLLLLSLALNNISNSLQKMGQMDLEAIGAGLATMSLILLELGLFIKLVGGEKGILSLSIGLNAIALSMALFAGSLMLLSFIPWDSLIKGLAAMGGVLVVIGTFSALIKNFGTTGLPKLGAGLAAIGLAMMVLAGAVAIFGNMEWETIGKGLLGMAGILGVLFGFSALMNAFGGGLVKLAAGLAITGTALMFLIPPFAVLGALPLQVIGVALLAIAGILTVLGVAGALAAKPIMALAAALGVLAASVLVIGIAMNLFAASLIAFAATGTAATGAMYLMVTALAELLPLIGEKIAEGIVAFLKVLEDSLPDILKSLGRILEGLLQVLIEKVPIVLDALFEFLNALLDKIIEYGPEFLEKAVIAILSLAEGFILGLDEGIPDVVKALSEFIATLIETFMEEFPKFVDRTVTAIIKFIKDLATVIRERSYEVGEAGVDLASALITGIINGIMGGIAGLVNGIIKACEALFDGFKKFFGIKSPSKLMAESGGYIIEGLLNGLTNGLGRLTDKAKEIGSKIFEGVKSAVSNIGSISKNVVDTLSNGLRGGISTVANAAKSLGNNILSSIKGVLGINSPAKAMIEIAHDTGDGLIIGLRDIGSAVNHATEDVGNDAIDGMKDSLSRISDVIDSDMELSPTIRPVIDLASVEQGLAHTFDKEQSLNVGEIKSKTANVATLRQNGSSSSGENTTTNNDNSEQKIEIINHFYVRTDSDIQKINRGLDNIMSKFNRTRGVSTNG